jgi:hypothetical protein
VEYPDAVENPPLAVVTNEDAMEYAPLAVE